MYLFVLNEIEDAFSLEFELDPTFYRAVLLLVFFYTPRNEVVVQ
jgi:hypothetical protein